MMQRLLQLFVFSFLFSSFGISQTAGLAGAFARMGFHARGIGMGNALSAVITGDVSSYYNPALSAFSEQRTGAATFGSLSLDRTLNFVSYTQAIQPTAGLSIGLINAGVRNIDGRDGDGYHTEDYSTFEDQFFLSFSNKIDPHLSLGVTVKLYYAKLFEQLKSTTVGFDAGALIVLTDHLTLGLALQDLNSKYKWDTKALYDVNGKSYDDKFPNLRRVALAYRLPFAAALLSAEFENSSESTNLFRFGAEYQLVEAFAIRAGVDRIDPSDKATGAKPSFGFTAKNTFGSWTPAVTYAYVFESFAPRGMHIITLSTGF